jgi:hypothetical protein
MFPGGSIATFFVLRFAAAFFLRSVLIRPFWWTIQPQELGELLQYQYNSRTTPTSHISRIFAAENLSNKLN